MIDMADISPDSKILEPSCGQGVFIAALQSRGFNDITAYEIDKELAPQFSCVHHESYISADIKENYDLIIGNPPYIRWKNLEDELKEELASDRLWSSYFNSLCDYSYIFILKSIELLRDKGQLIFICPEYWMNTTHAKPLRNYMVQNGYFEKIYHFNETPIFDDATVSIVIFKFVKSKSNTYNDIAVVKFYTDKQLTGNILNDLRKRKKISDAEYIEIPQFQIDERWALQTREIQEELRKIEYKCSKKRAASLFDDQLPGYYTIGDICDIGNGMVSGLDKAFQINGEDLNDEEKKATINVVKAKDLNQYIATKTTTYIFINNHINEKEFRKHYPNFFSHLQSYKTRLNDRYQYNKTINYWEWVFLRNYNLFCRNEKRIFVPCKDRISNKDHFRFSLVDPCIFPTQDVTAIFRKKTTKESIEYILAYLNNYRIFDWLKCNGVVKGSIVEFSESPVASIPFRAIDWENPDEVGLHDLITESVNKYLISQDRSILDTINNLFDKLFKDILMVNYKELIDKVKGTSVPRPISGTLSGHAAGEPFDKHVYNEIKKQFPRNTFRQYEFLNDLYARNPNVIGNKAREKLFNSLAVSFLLSRGKNATAKWSVGNPFEEKQNDTADILVVKDNFYEIIDIKTRNISKSAQQPNIISAYKLAQLCAKMIDNNEFDNFTINYFEVDWKLIDDKLTCQNAHYACLFKANPSDLYINWAAAMQIQFHVCDLKQSYTGSREEWARDYIKHFMTQARKRANDMIKLPSAKSRRN